MKKSAKTRRAKYRRDTSASSCCESILRNATSHNRNRRRILSSWHSNNQQISIRSHLRAGIPLDRFLRNCSFSAFKALILFWISTQYPLWLLFSSCARSFGLINRCTGLFERLGHSCYGFLIGTLPWRCGDRIFPY